MKINNMKKLFFVILASILCITLNANHTIKSNNNTQNIIEIESKPQSPEMSDSSEIGPGIITYNFIAPDVTSKNYFSPKNSYTLGVDKELIHVLDSAFSNDTLNKILDEILSVQTEYTNMIIQNTNAEFKRFQREKKIEAIAYLTFPFFSIICLIFIFTYRDEDHVRNPLTILLIALIIGTLITLPDIVITLRGLDYSVINSIGH